MIILCVVLYFVTVDCYKISMLSEGWVPVSREYVLNMQTRNSQAYFDFPAKIENNLSVVEPQDIQRDFTATVDDVKNFKDRKSLSCDDLNYNTGAEISKELTEYRNNVRKARKHVSEGSNSYIIENINRVPEIRRPESDFQENSHQKVNEKYSNLKRGYIYEKPINEGQELTEENSSKFTKLFLTFLKNVNINTDDYLDNYTKSRIGYKRYGRISKFDSLPSIRAKYNFEHYLRV